MPSSPSFDVRQGLFARYAVKQYDIGAHGQHHLEVDVRVIAHVADTVAMGCYIFVRYEIHARYPDDILHLAESVEHRYIT